MTDSSHSAVTTSGPAFAPKLEVMGGEQRGETFKLGLKSTIGRERDNDVILVDPRISRYHFQIATDSGKWILSDLGSANGTYVNGESVKTSRALQAGDIIVAGDTELVFRLPQEFSPVTRPVSPTAVISARSVGQAEGVNTRRLIWIAGSLLLILALAVTGVLILLNGRAQTLPATPVATPGQGGIGSGETWILAYEDDFSDPSSGWDDSFDKFTTKQYGNLKYYIEVNDSNLWARGLANREVSDFQLEVEATLESGPNNNGYGLLFRFRDRDNFYRFDVSGDGFYLISKFQNNEWSSLQDWTAHPAINKGLATNVLNVTAVGPEIRVAANGQELARITDDAFAGGNFGFFASTFSESNLLVSFDNLKLWLTEGARLAVIPTATPTRRAPAPSITPASASSEAASSLDTVQTPETTPTATAELEPAATERVQPPPSETPTMTPSPSIETPSPEALPDYVSRDQPLGREQSALQGRLFFPVYDQSRGTFDIYQTGTDGSGRELVWPEASQPSLNSAGDRIAFRSWKGDNRGLIASTLDGTDAWRFVTFFEAARPVWAAGGEFFLYHSRQAGEVPAVYRTVGEVGQVLRRQGGPIQGEMPAWLPDGRFVYRGCHNGCGLIISNLDGSFPILLTSHDSDTAPDVSPDGSQIAFMSRRDGNWEVYVVGVDGQNLTRVTHLPDNDGLPNWSPDGSHLAFVSDRDGIWEVWATRPDGSDQRVLFEIGGSLDGVVQLDVANSRGWTEERIDWVP